MDYSSLKVTRLVNSRENVENGSVIREVQMFLKPDGDYFTMMYLYANRTYNIVVRE